MAFKRLLSATNSFSSAIGNTAGPAQYVLAGRLLGIRKIILSYNCARSLAIDETGGRHRRHNNEKRNKGVTKLSQTKNPGGSDTTNTRRAPKSAKYNSGWDVERFTRVAAEYAVFACGSNFLKVFRTLESNSMPLLDKVQKDMVDAMKARDEARLGTLRMIKTALKKQEIDSMKPLTESTELSVMGTLLKQRKESIDMFRKGGREDLAAKEESEVSILEGYLPSPATAADLEQAVSEAIAETNATSAKQMGIGDEVG